MTRDEEITKEGQEGGKKKEGRKEKRTAGKKRKEGRKLGGETLRKKGSNQTIWLNSNKSSCHKFNSNDGHS